MYFNSLLTSSCRRPMNRFIELIVFFGLVIACRLAGAPTFRSPFGRNATTDGVVLAPSSFAITTGSLPSITATQLLVVPKSIPIILPIGNVFRVNYLFRSIVNDYATGLSGLKMGNNDTIKVISHEQNFSGDKKTALMAVATITLK